MYMYVCIYVCVCICIYIYIYIYIYIRYDIALKQSHTVATLGNASLFFIIGTYTHAFHGHCHCYGHGQKVFILGSNI